MIHSLYRNLPCWFLAWTFCLVDWEKKIRDGIWNFSSTAANKRTYNCRWDVRNSGEALYRTEWSHEVAWISLPSRQLHCGFPPRTYQMHSMEQSKQQQGTEIGKSVQIEFTEIFGCSTFTATVVGSVRKGEVLEVCGRSSHFWSKCSTFVFNQIGRKSSWRNFHVWFHSQ